MEACIFSSEFNRPFGLPCMCVDEAVLCQFNLQLGVFVVTERNVCIVIIGMQICIELRRSEALISGANSKNDQRHKSALRLEAVENIAKRT